jgi:chaperone required for assembly of F1-ATPase
MSHEKCGNAKRGTKPQARNMHICFAMDEGLMRERNKTTLQENPIEAARRAVRPLLRQRFYARVTIADAADGYAVRLDDKPVRTPAGRLLAAPSETLAQVIAAEWEAQRDTIDLATMPLTRLANSIIDGVADQAAAVAAEVANYLASDLVYYRAGAPQGLVERQSRAWDPILTWACDAFGARLAVGEGIRHVAQSDAALAAAGAGIPDDPWRLGAVHAATTLTGSALIALALLQRQLSAEEAWQAAHVDEDWNIEQWGHDDVAAARRAFQFMEFRAAARVLASL